MKTSEFIEKAKKLSFISDVYETEHKALNSFGKCLILKESDNSIIATIAVESEFLFSIVNLFSGYTDLDFNQRKQLFNLLTEYAATPISERKDKTIEEKAREYIQECVNENHDFYSCIDNLLYNDTNARESEIYSYYVKHSNEFVKIWCEVAADEH